MPYFVGLRMAQVLYLWSFLTGALEMLKGVNE